jgi:hypothetical protein
MIDAPGEKRVHQERGRRRNWRGWWVLAVAGLLLAVILGAGAGGAVFASSYQPVSYGIGGSAIEGGTVVVRQSDSNGQKYLPRQPAATGNLIVSLRNTGPYAVTIRSVSLPSVLMDNGPATYVSLAANRPVVTGTSPRIAGAVLRPGGDILVRIPFRTPSCWRPGHVVLTNFFVTTRYWIWTRRFAVSFVDYPAQSDGKIYTPTPCGA